MLCNLNIEGNLHSYEDETALIVTGDTWQSVTKIAENSLSKIILNGSLIIIYH